MLVGESAGGISVSEPPGGMHPDPARPQFSANLANGRRCVLELVRTFVGYANAVLPQDVICSTISLSKVVRQELIKRKVACRLTSC